MDHLNLRALCEQAAGKSSLESKLQELNRQKARYQHEIFDLEELLAKEQSDVQKLEGRSLTNYFLQVIGRMDRKLDQERREAYAAQVKVDAAIRELHGVEEDICRIERQLYETRVAEMRYEEGLQEKRAALKASGTPVAAQILELEQQSAALQARNKEILEAISAGRSARITAERILSKLQTADNWNTWDLFGGDGIITHMAKYSNLDDAQGLVYQLQGDLRRFRTELADIRITTDAQVSVEGFLRFADYFFDGLFADWAVGNRISQAQGSVSKTKRQIEQTVSELERLLRQTEQQITDHADQIEALILDA